MHTKKEEPINSTNKKIQEIEELGCVARLKTPEGVGL